MTQEEHSPLPWRYVEGRTNEGESAGIGSIVYDDGDDLWFIATIENDVGYDGNYEYGKTERANAAYIVKCCNAFPALVEALEGLITLNGHASEYAICREDGEKGGLGEELMIAKLFDQAIAALKAAKGE